MKTRRLLKIFISTCLIMILIVILVNWRSPDNQRAKLCQNSKMLTQIAVKNYDADGVKLRGGTFWRQVSLDSKKQLRIIIFPEALDSQTWSKFAKPSIQYIGKGGDDSWKEWLRPDYFYVLDVPPQATALAFGRLCYRNGDVEVESIKKIQEVSPGKIIINDKIYLAHPFPSPKINPSTIIVNAGSNYLDALGTQTEVYFTNVSLSPLPEKNQKRR